MLLYKIQLACLLILSFSASVLYGTEIYRSVDAHGRVTYSDTPSANAQIVPIINRPSRQLYAIERVYDGDTVILENGQSIRLLGINTPEIESRHRADEPGGMAAKEWLQTQLQDHKVYLEFDEEKQDKYQRQLAHLFLPNDQHLNLALVEQGLAAVSIVPPNLRYADVLTAAQQRAEKQKKGIWSMPEYQPRPISQIGHRTKGWQRLVGTPVSIKKSRKYTRLIFNNKVDLRIANSHLDLFPALQTYLGKPLEMRGWMSRSKDRYSMLIQHPSALIVQ